MPPPRRPIAYASLAILALGLAACKGTTPQPSTSDTTGTVVDDAPTAAITWATRDATAESFAADLPEPAALSVEPGPLATVVRVERRPGTPYTDAPAFGGAAPAHLALTFDDDTLSDSPLARQLRVYPVAAWRDLFQAQDSALIGERVDDLRRLITERPPDLAGPRGGRNEIPVLPLIGASQVMAAQPRILDFAGGSGVAFVTTYAQDPQPLTNDNLFYTFQGLTDDSRFWISVFYPVQAAGLPTGFADAPAAADPQRFMTGFPAYLEQVTSALDGLTADQYRPSLDRLDAMVRSIALTTLDAGAEPDAAVPPTAEDADAASPATADLRRAHLRLGGQDGDLRLTDGIYIATPPAGQATGGLDVRLLDAVGRGDLNGDGIPDAALAVAISSGGSGRFIHLAPFLGGGSRPDPIPTLLLGDRVQVTSLAIADGRLTADLVVHGPSDPMCCPSRAESRSYSLDASGALTPAP